MPTPRPAGILFDLVAPAAPTLRLGASLLDSQPAPTTMADDLLQRLGDLEREDDDDFPHEWEAVVAGSMSAEEARRQRPDAPEDEQARFAELFTPLTEGGVDDLVDALQSVLAASPPTADADVAGAAEVSQPAAPAAPPIDLGAARARRRGLVTALGGLVAVAAALALWLRPVDDGAGLDLDLRPYTLDVRNDEVRGQRSGEAGDARPEAPARYRPDSTLRWVLAPDEAVDLRGGDLSLGAWAAPPGGAPRALDRGRLDAHAAISDAGVIELRGAFAEVFDLEPGTWELRFAVGRVALGEGYAAAEAAAEAGDAVLVGPYTVELVAE
ncbi:MAG: hypothetical protein R3A79_25975 [Nannocystaceae bacterium]